MCSTRYNDLEVDELDEWRRNIIRGKFRTDVEVKWC